MGKKNILSLFSGIINVLSIIANAFGIRWLVRFRKPYSNQIKIIGNISLADIFISVISLSMTITDFATSQKFVDLYLHLYLVRSSIYIAWFLMFYLLMFDRFLGSCFPLWYRGNAPPNWARNSLCVCWTVFVFALVLCLTAPQQLGSVIRRYVWLVLDILFIILFAVLYSAIYCVKRRSNARTGRGVRSMNNKRFFGVTSAMLVAFMLLEALPSSLTSVLFMNGFTEAILYERYFEITWSLNILADPLIYIFMQPKARRDVCGPLLAFCFSGNKDTPTNKISSPGQNRIAHLETVV